MQRSRRGYRRLASGKFPPKRRRNTWGNTFLLHDSQNDESIAKIFFPKISPTRLQFSTRTWTSKTWLSVAAAAIVQSGSATSSENSFRLKSKRIIVPCVARCATLSRRHPSLCFGFSCLCFSKFVCRNSCTTELRASGRFILDFIQEYQSIWKFILNLGCLNRDKAKTVESVNRRRFGEKFDFKLQTDELWK